MVRNEALWSKGGGVTLWDNGGEKYDALRHLASAAFPSSDRSKHMAMITAFLDETGDAADPAQHVVGMGGLIGLEADWKVFQDRWRQALAEAKVPRYKDAAEPFFHMREFKSCQATFKGWESKEAERNELYDNLLAIMETSRVVPFGAAMPLSAWRKLTDQQQSYHLNPYFFTAQFCIYRILSLTHDRPPVEKVASVFSEKYKVKKRIGELFDLFREIDPNVKARIEDPIFRDMRPLPPLQGADVVAYLLNHECRRQQSSPDEPQGEDYLRLVKAQAKYVDNQVGMFHFISEAEVMSQTKVIEIDIARRRREAG
ncbi:MAG: DUF3800 domain-containing protein [Acidobacteria bacterium]|nr:DUF3800 domain-containing protein [Acidobacteriota bacterium]